MIIDVPSPTSRLLRPPILNLGKNTTLPNVVPEIKEEFRVEK